MTDHPITPPPELVQQWRKSGPADAAANNAYELHIAIQAARWGADQELEACCNHLRGYQWGWVDRPDGTKMHRAVDLELARRPKPLTLRELALASVKRFEESGEFFSDQMRELEFIRKALEQLND